jgi:hypothetical protein
MLAALCCGRRPNSSGRPLVCEDIVDLTDMVAVAAASRPLNHCSEGQLLCMSARYFVLAFLIVALCGPNLFPPFLQRKLSSYFVLVLYRSSPKFVGALVCAELFVLISCFLI